LREIHSPIGPLDRFSTTDLFFRPPVQLRFSTTDPFFRPPNP
jgi:hypothetical protein